MQDTPTYRAACDAHDTGSSSLLDRLRDNVTGGLVAGAMAKILEIRHPGSLESIPRPLSPPEGPTVSALRPAADLVSHRYGWPEQEFTEQNSVMGEFGSEPWLSLRAGDAAVDFTLDDEHGEPAHLGSLLQTRPVVLTFGMFTCPAYQLSHKAEADLAKRFGDQLHFLHLYTLEPHPKGSNAPDVGRPWELRYSTEAQACTLGDREARRRTILANHPDCQRVLLDDLNPGGLVNPVWGTYGPAPRPGFLIRQDGVIDTSQLWFNAAHMQAAVRQLLGEG